MRFWASAVEGLAQFLEGAGFVVFAENDGFRCAEVLPCLVEIVPLEMDGRDVVVDGGVFWIHLNVLFEKGEGLFFAAQLEPCGSEMEDALFKMGELLDDLFEFFLLFENRVAAFIDLRVDRLDRFAVSSST